MKPKANESRGEKSDSGVTVTKKKSDKIPTIHS